MELGPGTDLGFYITPPSALSAVKALIWSNSHLFAHVTAACI